MSLTKVVPPFLITGKAAIGDPVYCSAESASTVIVFVERAVVGGTVKVKPERFDSAVLVATRTSPVEPAPTTAVICVEETTVNELAAVPPKLTWVIAERFVPVIVITSPVVAVVGLKAVMLGAVVLIV